jgi:hypothetical protein
MYYLFNIPSMFKFKSNYKTPLNLNLVHFYRLKILFHKKRTQTNIENHFDRYQFIYQLRIQH